MIQGGHEGRFDIGGKAHSVAAQQAAVNAAATNASAPKNWDISLQGNRRLWRFFESIPARQIPLAATRSVRRQGCGVRSGADVSQNLTHLHHILSGKNLVWLMLSKASSWFRLLRSH